MRLVLVLANVVLVVGFAAVAALTESGSAVEA